MVSAALRHERGISLIKLLALEALLPSMAAVDWHVMLSKIPN